MNVAHPLPLALASARPVRSARLYLGTAVLVMLVAVSGFFPSYWLPMSAGTLELHPLLHVHGALFFLWTLLMVLQSAFVVSGRPGWHRELGLAGIALAATMVFSGVLVQVLSLKSGLAGPRPDIARNVAALGFSGMWMFATYVGVAVANLRRPEVHRRLMVLASFAILGAALARLARIVPGTTQPERGWLAAAMVDLMLLVVVLIDRRITGSVHPAWIAGGAFLVGNQVLRTFIVDTAPWIAFTAWLAAL